MSLTFREIKYKRNKSKLKKKRLAYLFLFVIVLSVPVLYIVNLQYTLLSDVPSVDLNFMKPNPTDITIKTIKHFYAPVVKFTDPRSDITLNELKSSQLVTISENVDIFLDGYQADVVGVEKLAEELELGKIAILQIDQITPNFKTLSIESKNLWDENVDLRKYPLTFTEKIPGESGSEMNFSKDKINTIFVGGEIIPARAVDRLGLNVHNDYTYLFDFVRQDIESADLAIAQLENPLMGDPSPCTGCTVFVGDEKNAKGFSDVGFDILAVSGNHVGDGGQKAYEPTIKALTDAGVNYTGIGKGVDDQLKPALFDLNGRVIGMISADDVSYFYWSSDKSVYGVNSFSTASNGVLNINMDKVEMIETLKQENNIDYLIIYESWGIEYTNKANSHQVELAHAFIDNGADLVVASHPHWVQNIEFYKGKPIFYALGNFIFDQTHTLPTRQSVVANLNYYQNELRNIEIIPLQTCGYHQTKNDQTVDYLAGKLSLEQLQNMEETEGCVWWQPRKLLQNSEEYKQILDRLLEFSLL
jgi:poly-gamma-glutamate synthesis protein (capsule biosynthesis protein)